MDAYAQLRYNQQLNAGNPSNLIKRKRFLNKYQYKKYYNFKKDQPPEGEKFEPLYSSVDFYFVNIIPEFKNYIEVNMAETSEKPQNYHITLLDSEAYQRRIKLMKNRPKKLNIPNYIQTIIVETRLYDIDDHDERAKTFLRRLYRFKYRSSTIAKHFYRLKPLLFPTTQIIPNSMVFDNKRGILQRVPDFDAITNLVNFLNETTLDGKWPILLAFYTGLRLSEISELKASHITQLLEHKEIIALSRKGNTEWVVVYFSEFDEFIKKLYTQYKELCDYYQKTNIDQYVFNTSSRLIHYNITKYYMIANNNTRAPYGFGIHAFRYYIGTKLVEQGNIDMAQIFLGHKYQKTTKRYIVYDKSRLDGKLKEINKTNELYREIIEHQHQTTTDEIEFENIV